jgi:hypothetical protein
MKYIVDFELTFCSKNLEEAFFITTIVVALLEMLL